MKKGNTRKLASSVVIAFKKVLTTCIFTGLQVWMWNVHEGRPLGDIFVAVLTLNKYTVGWTAVRNNYDKLSWRLVVFIRIEGLLILVTAALFSLPELV